MPIYEYRCGKCGNISEFLILGREESLTCKDCGSKNLVKIMSAHNTSTGSSEKFHEGGHGSCCGSPHSCDTPGGCCSH